MTHTYLVSNANFFPSQAKVHILSTGADAATRTTGSGDTLGSMVGANEGYTNGMTTFVLPKVGAMIDVSVEGQRFNYSAIEAWTLLLDHQNVR